MQSPPPCKQTKTNHPPHDCSDGKGLQREMKKKKVRKDKERNLRKWARVLLFDCRFVVIEYLRIEAKVGISK